MNTHPELSRRKPGLSAAKRAILQKQLEGKIALHRPAAAVIPKRPQDPSPLSFSQQQLFLLDQLEPGAAVYNFSMAVRLSGALDIPVLERALNEIVRRHESLRTVFVIEDSEPVQKVLPELRITIAQEDLSALPAADRAGQLDKRLRRESQKPFDLAKAPLLRVSLFRLTAAAAGEPDSVLLIAMPHIITDGWSAAVFARELAALYDAYLQGRPSPLPELSVQYADFSHWQRQRLHPAHLEKMLAFWENHLADAASGLELPADHARPAVQRHRGGDHGFHLSRELSDRLAGLCRERNVTLFALLFSAFNVLLHRYTGEKNLCVGAPVANRSLAEIEPLIGYFVNVLALHTDLSGNPEFSTLVRRTHDLMLDSQPHQEYPFELLVKRLRPHRDPSVNPLFQVMFVLHNVPFDGITVSGLRISPFAIPNRVSKFDLTLHVTEEPRGILISFEYNTDLFETATIQRMAGHFERLLENIAAAPETRIGEFALLSPAELHTLTREWNPPAAAESPRHWGSGRTVHELFEARTRRFPEAIAVATAGRALSYAEVNAEANRLAHHLKRLGVGPDSRVALCIGRAPEMIIGLLGVLKSGGAYVPLDPNYPQEELAHILRDSGAEFLITQGDAAVRLKDFPIPRITLDEDRASLAGQPDSDPGPPPAPEHLAYVIYTSGSTGKPKGVAISHHNLMQSTRARFEYYKEPVDRFLLLSSFAFDSSVAGIFWTLTGGGALYIPEECRQADPAALVDWIAGERITHLLCLPSFYGILLEQADAGRLDSLRTVIVAGEACLPGMVDRHCSRLPNTALHNEYGPTEGTVWSSVYHIPPEPLESPIPIGRPIPGMEIYLLDAYLNPVPVGVCGEIHIGGEGLAGGYLNQPELTAARFVPHPFARRPGTRLYRTGDRARYRADGNLLFLGRVDHQVKIRGFRIELGEIEANLLKYPGIEEAVVVDQEGANGSKHLVAYVKPSKGQSGPDLADLRAFLQALLPGHMIPAAFVVLEKFPLTPNGKLDRKALPVPNLRAHLEGRYLAPRNGMEQTLAILWQEVLGLERVGVTDNFFEIGGDSILSMQLVNRAKQAGLRLAPRQLLEHQTVESLAKVVSRATAIHADQHVITGDLPLTPVQRWFLERPLARPDHWNQSVLLEVQPPFEVRLLEGLVRRLAEHHDMLRGRFTRTGEGWRQSVAGEVAPHGEITAVDLSGVSPQEREAVLAEEASRWQASLDLERGPLYRFVWFDLGREGGARLLIVAHHLIVDGMSWRILLEDLSTLYRQALAGGEPVLPSKTSAFKLWSERLSEYAQTETPRRNLRYWLNLDRNRIPALPLDFRDGLNTESTRSTVTATLDAARTSRLLRNASAIEGARINELLLAAVAAVLAEWMNSPSVWIELEGHGREPLFDDLDISRTVGWFTSLFPVLLDVAPGSGFSAIVRAVKAQVDSLPNHGLDYGVIRYLSTDPALVSRLRGIPDPDIGFNYLGQLDRGVDFDSPFSLSQESAGAQRDPEGQRIHTLDIDAFVLEGQLQVQWTYSTSRHLPESVENLSNRVLRILEEAAAANEIAEGRGKAVGPKAPPPVRVDLAPEARLDPSIRPQGQPAKSWDESRNILLTGVTGFVGPFLLDELLGKTEATIYCLVRSDSVSGAAEKIRQALTTYGIENPQLHSRIVPVPGDLAKPRLGLSETQFGELSRNLDLIFHNGSSTNLVLPYPALKAANVLGTRELLRLACNGKTKPLHYVSTLSIFDDGTQPTAKGFTEEDLPSLDTRLGLGYSQSKLVAEHLIAEARGRGLPVSVYRLGTVTGHSETGAWNTGDFHCRLLEISIGLGLFPTNKLALAFTPVDFISRSIVGLASLSSSGQTYHLFNPHPTPVADLILWLDRFGYPMREASPSHWLARFSEAAAEPSRHRLQALAPVFESYIPHQQDSSIPYRCDTTMRTLRLAQVDLPAMTEAVLFRSLDYLIRAGILPKPKPV